MASRNGKNRWMGILLGPLMVFFSLTGLWKNETRFDYHKAAAKTVAVESPAEAAQGGLFSLTGGMDRELTLAGEYVESFTGYLFVRRNAEIFAWDHDKDDDGVKWNREWMSSLEGNERNEGLKQELRQGHFEPDQYQVGPLPVATEMIEFVDRSEPIPPSVLELTHRELRAEDGYFYWRKGGENELGDERVSYSGMPVPAQATYFGRFDAGRGVADTTERRSHWTNRIIGDTGVLHHLVAGDRDTALATMKRHIGRVKWIVRGIGTICVCFGLLITFSTILGFLYLIPYVGRVAEAGAFLLAIVFGLPLSLLAITSAYLIAHPVIPAVLVGALVAGYFLLRNKGRESRAVVRESLGERYGHVPEPGEMKELEFGELARLAERDGKLDESELGFLQQWARRQGWSDQRFREMLETTRSDSAAGPASSGDHFENLIRLALADGRVSRHEMKAIRRVGGGLGHNEASINRMIRQIRQSI